MKQDNPNLFSSHDFYHSAFCLKIGFELKNSEIFHGKSIVHFSNTGNITPNITLAFFEKIVNTLQDISMMGEDPHVKSLINDLLKEVYRVKNAPTDELAMRYFRSEEKKVLDAYRTIKDFAYSAKEKNVASL